MTERSDDPHVTDPFLARIALPSMEERDPEAIVPMVWPIAPPRVRKVLMARIEDVADHHFFAKIFSGVLAGAVILMGGGALFLLIRVLGPVEVDPWIFAGSFAVLFAALAAIADRFRPPGPMEIYYSAHGGPREGNAQEAPGGRLIRAVLFGPYLVSVAFRKILEPPPPADEETLDVALRLLPMLHAPLPLHQAELAGIADRDQVRRASLLLFSLDLADIVVGPRDELLLTPRSACAKLLRGEGQAPPRAGDGEDAPWLEMEPDMVSTAEIDTMELLAEAERLGLDATQTIGTATDEIEAPDAASPPRPSGDGET